MYVYWGLSSNACYLFKPTCQQTLALEIMKPCFLWGDMTIYIYIYIAIYIYRYRYYIMVYKWLSWDLVGYGMEQLAARHGRFEPGPNMMDLFSYPPVIEHSYGTWSIFRWFTPYKHGDWSTMKSLSKDFGIWSPNMPFWDETWWSVEMGNRPCSEKPISIDVTA